MLMGVSPPAPLLRVAVASFASAFLWSLVLSMAGKMVMATLVFCPSSGAS